MHCKTRERKELQSYRKKNVTVQWNQLDLVDLWRQLTKRQRSRNFGLGCLGFDRGNNLLGETRDTASVVEIKSRLARGREMTLLTTSVWVLVEIYRSVSS